MRGTTAGYADKYCRKWISTHVPHAGHDPDGRSGCGVHYHFNSRAPCGARPNLTPYSVLKNGFQLTCPMRGTTETYYYITISGTFQLTCPMRGTTIMATVFWFLHRISTHVPHAGHDDSTRVPCVGFYNFNSRAPCGARPARS